MTDLDVKTGFTFDELDDRAKEKARDKFRENNLDYDWWDTVYGDAQKIGDLLGINIGEQRNRTVKGVEIRTPDISFSGFCQQGDGCSFGGMLWVHNLNGAIARINDEVSDSDPALNTLARTAQDIYEQAVTTRMTLRLKGQEDLDEVNDMRFLIENRNIWGSTTVVTPYEDDSWHDEFTESLRDYARAFAAWIYKQLEAEYGHLQSNESIDDLIQSGEFIFDEFGSTI